MNSSEFEMMSINQLMDDLSLMFIPIFARVTEKRYMPDLFDRSISMLPETDYAKYVDASRRFVNAWFNILYDNFHGTAGISLCDIDDVMLPALMTDRELVEKFWSVEFYYHGCTVVNVEFIKNILKYYKIVFCSNKILPDHMIRLLELNNIQVEK